MPDDELKPVLTELARGMTELAKGMAILNNEERRDIWDEIKGMRQQGTFIEKQLIIIDGKLNHYKQPCEQVAALIEADHKRSSFFTGLVKTAAAVCVTGAVTFMCFLIWHWFQAGAPRP